MKKEFIIDTVERLWKKHIGYKMNPILHEMINMEKLLVYRHGEHILYVEDDKLFIGEIDNEGYVSYEKIKLNKRKLDCVEFAIKLKNNILVIVHYRKNGYDVYVGKVGGDDNVLFAYEDGYLDRVLHNSYGDIIKYIVDRKKKRIIIK